jgi:hypothetical protein
VRRPDPTYEAIRTAAALTLAWSLTATYSLPWYDVAAWAPIALLAATPYDWLLIARTSVLSVAYIPGRVVDLPAGLMSSRAICEGLSLRSPESFCSCSRSSWHARGLSPIRHPDGELIRARMRPRPGSRDRKADCGDLDSRVVDEHAENCGGCQHRDQPRPQHGHSLEGLLQHWHPLRVGEQVSDERQQERYHYPFWTAGERSNHRVKLAFDDRPASPSMICWTKRPM